MYRGRFAPSPTGPLHLGSLVTAAAGFLTARKAQGEWLLRIDDIDPPREEPGAGDEIKRQLDAFGLHWDGPVFYQSDRHGAYQEALATLRSAGLAYQCTCSRAKIAAHPDSNQGRRYPGTCRHGAGLGQTAWRVLTSNATITFDDRVQGPQSTDLEQATGDYVIYRKDGLPAYHLACALDEHEQGITEVVRGIDLLPSTANHIHLQQQLGLNTPQYAHTPVVVANNHKLSKQAGATPVSTVSPSSTICWVLNLLDLPVSEVDEQALEPVELWQWAVKHWQLDTLRTRSELALENFGPAPGNELK